MGQQRDARRGGELLNARYRLGTYLGEDGSVEIYAATDTRGGNTEVTVRVLRPEFALQPAAIDQLVKLPRTLSGVDHPNLPQVVTVESDDTGIPFVVEEAISGKTLAELLTDFPEGMPLGAARVLLAPVVETLARAHMEGAVHGRLHPARIILDESGGGTLPRLVQHHSAVDAFSEMTEAYTAPECRDGSPPADATVDVWGLGVLLYHVLSGNVPDTRKGSTLVALKELAPHLPANLTAAIAACLWDDPAERIFDAGVLWMRIESVLTSSAPAKSDAGVGASAVNALGATMIATAAPVIATAPESARPVLSSMPPALGFGDSIPPADEASFGGLVSDRPPAPAADEASFGGLVSERPPPPAASEPELSFDGLISERPPAPVAAAAPPPAAPAPPSAPPVHGGATATLVGNASPAAPVSIAGAPATRAPAAAMHGAPAAAPPAGPEARQQSEWPQVEVDQAPATSVAPPPAARAESEWPQVHVDEGQAPAVSQAPRGLDDLASAFQPLERDSEDVANAVKVSSAPPARTRDGRAHREEKRRKQAKKKRARGQLGSELSHDDGFAKRSASLGDPALDGERKSKAASVQASGSGADKHLPKEERKAKAAAVAQAQMARLMALREGQEESEGRRWLRLVLLLLLLLFMYKGSAWLYEPNLVAAREVFGEKLQIMCIVFAATMVVAMTQVMALNAPGAALLARPIVYVFQAVTLMVCVMVGGTFVTGGFAPGGVASGGFGMGGGFMGMVGGFARGGLAWGSGLLFLFAALYALMEGARSMAQSMAFAGALLAIAIASGGASYGVIAATVMYPRPPVEVEVDDDEDAEQDGNRMPAGAQDYLEMAAEVASDDSEDSEESIIERFMNALKPGSAEMGDVEQHEQNIVQPVDRKTIGGAGDEKEMIQELRDMRTGNVKEMDKLQEQMPDFGL